jgi:hypothetical protein
VRVVRAVWHLFVSILAHVLLVIGGLLTVAIGLVLYLFSFILSFLSLILRLNPFGAALRAKKGE